MIPYILHVALLISICLLFYKIFLQRETFYRLNRLVLVICLGLSFILPLISIPQAWTLRSAPTPAVVNIPQQVTPVPYQQAAITEQVKKATIAKQQPVVIKAAPVTAQDTPFMPTAIKWAIYLYWAGVAAFGLNLLLQVVVLLIRAYTNPVILDGKFRIIEVKGDKAPCSFGNNIFINPEKYEWETYNQILLHEKVHIQQGHSFDILLAELVLVFQWFNPFAWLYRGELENNLEFLTDEAVLDDNTVERSSYQMSLLKVSAPHLALSVTTNYNQSLLKKRIVMMNAKRSNIHTMWKYFILVPLMGGLACALNQTVAFSQTKTTKTKTHHTSPSQKNWGITDRTEGSWFAQVKEDDRLNIEFKGDNDHNDWTSNSDNFKLSELTFPSADHKGDFSITRDAGTIQFTGNFDGKIGSGHYKFTANKAFTDYVGNEGITDIDFQDQFAFFMVNISRGYIKMLKENGYGHISKNEMISMGALKVDAPFIKYWKESGYHLSANELVSAKALGVDGEYVNEIKNAGYKDLSFNQLISFKAQGINEQYINSIKKAGMIKSGKDNAKMPSADDLSSYKALNVDSSYVSGFKDAGYTDVPFNDLTSMKAVGVTPEYAKSMAALGLKDISANELVSLKSLGVTPEYVKSFRDMGYKDISANEIMSVKSLGITPVFIKSFEDIGYKNLSIDELTSLKSLGVTHEYIKSFEAAGYKQIPFNELFSLKSLGVTPGFIKGFKDMGYNVSLDEATSLKATGVTPAYVKEMKAKGFNSKDLNKYIQIKSAFN